MCVGCSRGRGGSAGGGGGRGISPVSLPSPDIEAVFFTATAVVIYGVGVGVEGHDCATTALVAVPKWPSLTLSIAQHPPPPLSNSCYLLSSSILVQLAAYGRQPLGESLGAPECFRKYIRQRVCHAIPPHPYIRNVVVRHEVRGGTNGGRGEGGGHIREKYVALFSAIDI